MSKRNAVLGLVIALACGRVGATAPLELQPASLRLSPGAAAVVSAVFDRGPSPGQGAVTVWTEGAPHGLAIEIESSPTFEPVANLHLQADPGLSPGDYGIVVRAESPDGYQQAAQLVVSVRDPQPTAVEVDPAVQPSAAEFPRLEDGRPRPLARIVDPTGRGIDFITNELILSTADSTELEEFLARTGGLVVDRIDGQGLPGLAPQYLVRVDLALAEPGALMEHLAALDPNPHGRHRVSSDEGLRLLALFVREAALRHTVGVNVIGEDAGYSDRKLVDGPQGWMNLAAGTIDAAYTPNAFEWVPFRVGGGQNIGVAEAWRALYLAGKLPSASIRAAIVDGGFKSVDLPTAVGTAVGSAGGLGSPNVGTCSGKPCPWHGTHVAQAGFGVPGNGTGAAGPGGPVSNLYVVHTSKDLFSATKAIAVAASSGARVVNVSSIWRLPALMSAGAWPLNLVTSAARTANVLIVASAGNNNEDVDEYSCFGVCWEVAWQTPCENDGVLCVGGVTWDKKNIAAFGDSGGSNYGYRGDVGLFAPWDVYQGGAPDIPALGADADRGAGTSVSAPFVAGVAALVWAARPSLSASEVEAILIATAHPSPDGKVRRYVNALGAVKAVLGDVKPVVTIKKPATGTIKGYGGFNVVAFEATAEDVEDGSPCCSIKWSSSVDGALGSGTSFSFTFPSPGTRVVTARVVDSAGQVATASVTVHVVNGEPVPVIVKPDGTSVIYRGVPFTVEGKASDPNQSMPCSALKWYNGGGEPISATGCTPTITYTIAGPKALRLEATDERGLWTLVTVTFTVLEPPAGAPIVTITSPVAGAWLASASAHTLAGSAIDPDGDTALTFQWSVIDGGVEHVIGSGATLSWTPSATFGPRCAGFTVILRLRVTDSTGATGTAVRSVVVNYPIC